MEVYHVSTSLNRIPSSAAGTRAHSRQPQRVVGRLQERSLSETRQTRPAHHGVEGIGHCRASGKVHRRTGGKMKLVSSPALRPSHPHGCRKRAFRQGQALRGRFAGLDVHAVASGLIHSRATDEEASGGGSVKGSPQTESTKATTQKSVSRLSQLSRIPTRDGHGAHKPVPAYASLSFPDTYDVASRSAFRCPRRHVHHADLALCRILTAQFSYDVQSFAAYRLPMCQMVIWSRRYTHQQHAGYNSAPRLIRTRHVPDARIMRLRFRTDACSFVRHCLRGPAYVSSIRCAYSLTAGKGRRPFEPRKAQRQGKR